MAEDEIEEGSKLPPDARLESLDQRLDRLRQAEADQSGAEQSTRLHRFGQRMASQMVGAPIAGLLLGWGLDTVFKTKPLLMIVLMLGGFALGIRNVYYWTTKTPSSNDERATKG